MVLPGVGVVAGFRRGIRVRAMSTLFSKKRGSKGRKRPRPSAAEGDDCNVTATSAGTGPGGSKVIMGAAAAMTPSDG